MSVRSAAEATWSAVSPSYTWCAISSMKYDCDELRVAPTEDASTASRGDAASRRDARGSSPVAIARSSCQSSGSLVGPDLVAVVIALLAAVRVFVLKMLRLHRHTIVRHAQGVIASPFGMLCEFRRAASDASHSGMTFRSKDDCRPDPTCKPSGSRTIVSPPVYRVMRIVVSSHSITAGVPKFGADLIASWTTAI